MARRKQRPEEVERELTRKETRLRARARDRNRKIMTWVGAALALALLLVIAGLVTEFVVRPNSTVATVGGTELVTRNFWKRTFLEQNRLQNQMIRLSQLEQQFGNQGFFATQINQIQGILSSPFTLGVEVLDQMIREEVVRQQAAERGITVTEAEIDEALREEVAAQQGAVTVPQATSTAEAQAEATATAESWTPTPTATVDASGTITATATPIPTPVPPPTSTILTDEQYATGLQELEDNLREIANMTLAEYRTVVTARLLDEKLAEAVGDELVEATEEQIRARHILLEVSEPISPTEEITPTDAITATDEVTGTAEITDTAEVTGTAEVTDTAAITLTDAITDPVVIDPLAIDPLAEEETLDEAEALALALDLRQQLLEGADFASLAAQYSDDPGSGANGGDLGWFGRGAMVAPFEEVAFNLEVGEISEPIRTDFGYHIIEVLERDAERPKDEAALESERAQAYSTWIEEQIAATPVERADIISKLPRNLEAVVPQAAPADAAPLPPTQ